MKSVDCDRYLELLSARLDGALTDSEQRELEAHLASCPECRAAGAQLETLQSSFAELEDIPAPEGFTQSMMGRVRAEETPKVIPRRFRALTGLAACLALAVGLYCVSRPRETYDMGTMTRDFVPDTQAEYADSPLDETAITRSVPEDAPESDGSDSDVYIGFPVITPGELILDRMPEGAWDLIPPETPAGPLGLLVSEELMEQIAQMAQEQGISASRSSKAQESGLYWIVVRGETE